MNNAGEVIEERRSVSGFAMFLGKLTTQSCLRFFVIIGVAIDYTIALMCLVVLAITREEYVQTPLRVFMFGHAILLFIQGGVFFLKHKGFFSSNVAPDFADSNELGLFSNLVDAVTFFWYLTGLHWSSGCVGCKNGKSKLYLSTILVIYFGLFKILAPLVALIVLVMLISYVTPKIPSFEYVEGSMKEEDAKCSICLERYVNGVRLKRLPCSHHFHSACIDGWFSVEELCPLCMKPLNIFHEMVDSSSPI